MGTIRWDRGARLGWAASLCFLSAAAQGAESPAATALPAVSVTAPWREDLTDRELALGRFFSQLTFLQDRSAQPWPQWHDDGQQMGITSLRYQLAFAGYGCAVQAARTPAYRELAARQLRDLCERLLDVRCWFYVTRYWKYGDQPPDPCLDENVMYTGHLTHLMCLYELLTGDTHYSDQGWDFTWRDGRRVHYTLRQAVERLHVQSERNVHGGVCCEPDLLFATCNSHSAASYLLHDLLHGTQYARVNQKWFDWMSQNFRVRHRAAAEVFYLMYHQGRQFFVPLSDVGGDGWTLGWGYPWFPSPELAREGWQQLLEKIVWRRPAPGQCFALNNLLVAGGGGCCGGGSPAALSNAFLPLLAFQVEGRASPTGQAVLRWLEANFGREIDLDADGHPESYYYHTDEALRIATTGNLTAALATDGDSLRQLFRLPRRQLLAEPTLAHVDYPRVYVRSAEYRAPVLRFRVLRGQPDFQGSTEIVCTQIPQLVSVSRDGQPWRAVHHTGSTLRISTDLAGEHVFEVSTLDDPKRTIAPAAEHRQVDVEVR